MCFYDLLHINNIRFNYFHISPLLHHIQCGSANALNGKRRPLISTLELFWMREKSDRRPDKPLTKLTIEGQTRFLRFISPIRKWNSRVIYLLFVFLLSTLCFLLNANRQLIICENSLLCLGIKSFIFKCRLYHIYQAVYLHFLACSCKAVVLLLAGWFCLPKC